MRKFLSLTFIFLVFLITPLFSWSPSTGITSDDETTVQAASSKSRIARVRRSRSRNTASRSRSRKAVTKRSSRSRKVISRRSKATRNVSRKRALPPVNPSLKKKYSAFSIQGTRNSLREQKGLPLISTQNAKSRVLPEVNPNLKKKYSAFSVQGTRNSLRKQKGLSPISHRSTKTSLNKKIVRTKNRKRGIRAFPRKRQRYV